MAVPRAWQDGDVIRWGFPADGVTGPRGLAVRPAFILAAGAAEFQLTVFPQAGERRGVSPTCLPWHVGLTPRRSPMWTRRLFALGKTTRPASNRKGSPAPWIAISSLHLSEGTP